MATWKDVQRIATSLPEAVLVYLKKIDKRELEELLTDAWACRAPKRLAKEFLTNRQA
ncbi:MAG TPA: hypothetical protein VFC19_17900 [Candidatus Limnocylindrales bacterium]|nr:hypothetical protein [Candidatus Limnocylindrales bacterium]